MKNETKHGECRQNMNGGSISGGAYGLAFLGALVYHIQHATSFGGALYGFVKALLWPAFLLYRLTELLRM